MNTTLTKPADFSEIRKLVEEWENEKRQPHSVPVYFHFNPNTISEEKLDSLSIPGFVKKNLINYRKAGGTFSQASDLGKLYGMNDSIYALIEKYISIPSETTKPKKKTALYKKKAPKTYEGRFDPNTANVKELMEFGFVEKQANTLINYRKKGGAFHKPEDLLKLYTVDSVFFASIKNNISIAAQTPISEPEAEELVVVELNTADTSELMMLKGVGSWYAHRIIKYRNLLGGFYCKSQVKEIYNFPEEVFNTIESQLRVDTTQISKIRINFAEYSELIRHPYLKKDEVRLILKTRETQGPFKNLTQLENIEGFDAEIFSRVKPYFTCR